MAGRIECFSWLQNDCALGRLETRQLGVEFEAQMGAFLFGKEQAHLLRARAVAMHWRWNVA